MSDPLSTQFEQDISDAADLVYRSGKTGYNWGPVDKILKDELGLDGKTRCKKANSSGRAANVITESMDKQIQLYLVFISKPYSVQRFIPVAKDRIKRFPNAKTVAVLDQTSGTWRMRAVIEREGVGLAKRIKGAFPTLEDDEIYYVESKPPPSESEAVVPLSNADEGSDDMKAIPTVPIVDEDEFASEMMSRKAQLTDLSMLPVRLIDFASQRGVILDLSLAVDLLAVVLSSQLLMFAGPSGTGKSTMARLLGEFFAPADHRFKIEAMRQWMTPDDLVGYYSVLGKQYAAASATQTIVGMHEVSVAATTRDDGGVDGPPILLIEEMNLSAPEGYLAPVIHGLSGVSEPVLRWELHSESAGALNAATLVALPPVALFGPYPRIFGTINVDASAHAPARKVVARSSVVLLEPVELTEAELTALAGSAMADEDFEEDPYGADFLGDPLASLKEASAGQVSVLVGQLREFVSGLDGLPVSRRDATRCLAYMAYFCALSGNESGADDAGLRLAAENAISHCVLPTVEAGRFTRTLEVLKDLELVAEAATSTELGGLLGARVQRLLEITTDGSDMGAMLDFWSALS